MQIKMHIINNSILYKKIKNAEIFISAFFIWLRYYNNCSFLKKAYIC